MGQPILFGHYAKKKYYLGITNNNAIIFQPDRRHPDA